jgi:hypothetical protein
MIDERSGALASVFASWWGIDIDPELEHICSSLPGVVK